MSVDPAAANLNQQDEAHLRRALMLAERGLYTTDPNPRVGCVIADAQGIVGEGWHVRAGEPHAEVLALRAAGNRARGADVYVTLEPCSHTGRTPPCADALIAAGVARVWCCTADPNPKVAGSGIERLRAAGIEVNLGAFGAQARALNPGFFSRFERHRPYVRLKMAMSLDARTAPGGPAPASPTPASATPSRPGAAGSGQVWISGEASRADVQTWRARSSAVLTGSGTVLCDDPKLNVRLNYGPWVRQPLRVVLDTELRCRPGAQIFQDGGALTFAASDAPGSGALNVERVARAAGGLDLDAVIARLAALEINELLLECGARLAGAFLAKGLVDEMVLYVAPGLMGQDAAPLAYFGGGAPWGGAPRDGTPCSGATRDGARRDAAHGAVAPALSRPFEFSDVRRVGDDVRLVLTSREN
jgi:diaminohydroxyphosphoribosylaminopyrimidine deaminase/5-amino-6-(5-phosphoribosylamino)uracil reductase